MKRVISLVLVLIMCLTLCACGSNTSPTEKVDNGSTEAVADAPSGKSSLPKNIQMYAPGTIVETNFGSIAIMDVAFCGKAQLIDGLPWPAYNKAEEGRIVFAMRAMISNTSDTDLVLLDDLKVSIQYSKDDSFGCSKGGNYESADPLYKTLPAGTSGEYLISGRVPVEVYESYSQFYVSFNDAKLGFDYQDIQVYNSMGYQEEDNTVASIDDVIALATGQENAKETVETTEPVVEETEPATDFVSVEYPKNPEANIAEGEGVVIQEVKLGFADQLPKDLLKYSPSDAERMTLNESMVYAVIQFKIKNLTAEDIDIADLHDDFLVELNYNNKFRYNTNSDAGACFISQGSHKLVWKNSSSGQAIEVAPLAMSDVQLYIPCAREVSTDTENPLRIIFNSKFGGYESFEFVVR